MSASTLTIALDRINAEPAAQVRAQLDGNLVRDYAQALAAGAAFPPATLFQDPEGHPLWLADGRHRLEAHRQAGRMEIEAEIRSGNRREAVLYAVGANANHGLRRSNLDKRKCVAALLADPEWAQWSDRAIARQCAVHHDLVAQVRKQVSGGFRQIGRLVQRGTSRFVQTARPVPRNGTGERIAPDVQELLQDSGWSGGPGESEQLAQLTPAIRSEVALRLACGEVQTVAEAVEQLPEGPSCDDGRTRPRADAPAVVVGVTPYAELRRAYHADTSGSARVQPGEWWRLAGHRLYCGGAAAPAFQKPLGQIARPALAFQDLRGQQIPLGGSGASSDWLGQRAATVTVSLDPDGLQALLRRSAVAFRHVLAVVMDKGGCADWSPLCLQGQTPADLPTVLSLTGDPDGELAGELQLQLLPLLTPDEALVLDPDLREGGTLLAATLCGRTCWGAVADPHAADRILGRWEALTGLQAEPSPVNS